MSECQDQRRSNRHTTVRGPGRWAVSAAALACLAGTTTALGQTALEQAMAAGEAAQSQSQPNPTREPGLRDPMGAEGNESTLIDGVTVDENLIVDLHVNDEDLANVLKMLSIQSQRSILSSRNVSATVTADLYGVTFYEALDGILHVNGYGYVEKGNFIYVYTLEELQEIEQASRPRVAKLVNLNYLNAVDAAEFVKPMLSEGGQIKTNGKTEGFVSPGDTPTGADEYALGATLLIFDYQEQIDEIERLLAELDTKPAQVLVEATILQTAINEANAFGVDFSVLGGDINFSDFTGVGGALKSIDGLISGKGGSLSGGSSTAVPLPGPAGGGGVSSTPGNTAGPGTFKAGVVAGDVAVFLKLLDEVSDTSIISNPKILALNRMSSRVLVGRKVGYLNTTSTDTATTQTVEFLDTGTQLYIRPFVSNDGLIRMELKPQVSEAVIRNATDATGAAVTIPDEITNELVTNVMVRDGQTIVLGGLFRDSTNASRRQVPLLGDLPVVGAAFRGHDDATQRNEIIFMITPTIVNDQILLEQGEEAKNMVDRVRTGAREGLLPWSREKMTGMLNVEAERLAADGQNEKALWKVQQSLGLYPQQPDAIELRERLSNQSTRYPNKSMLERIMRRETESRMGSTITSQDESDEGFTTGEPEAATFGETTAGESEMGGGFDGFTGADADAGFTTDGMTNEFTDGQMDAEPTDTDQFSDAGEGTPFDGEMGPEAGSFDDLSSESDPFETTPPTQPEMSFFSGESEGPMPASGFGTASNAQPMDSTTGAAKAKGFRFSPFWFGFRRPTTGTTAPTNSMTSVPETGGDTK